MYEVEHSKKGWSKYLKSVFICLLIVIICYSTCYFIWLTPFLVPTGIMFSIVLVWILGHIGGFLASQCRIPALLGMLLIGIMFENVPGLKTSLEGYSTYWETRVKAFGLATILMRAGLKINYTLAFKQAPWTVLLLGLLPVFSEGFIDSLIFWKVFDMPYFFAAMSGFLLSAISPTVVVTGMLDLQKKGYGMKENVPSVCMAAAGVDVVCGICMFSIFESLAIAQASGSNDPWALARGPASIGLGIVASLVGGTICGCTKLFSSQWHRTAMVFSLGQMFMFLLNSYYQMPGGGALAAIGVGGTAAIVWQFGFPKVFSVGPHDEFRGKVDEHLSIFWTFVMQPILFCTIGVSVNFEQMSISMLPKAILVIVVGSITRVLTAFGTGFPSGWNWRIMLFAGMAWVPKATVQGALSGEPLRAVEANVPQSSPQYDDYVFMANEILATAVLAIFITAPIGLLAINLVGPILLPNAKDQGKSAVSRLNSRRTDVTGRGITEEIVTVRPIEDGEVDLSANEEEVKNGLFAGMFSLQMEEIGVRKKRDVGTQVNEMRLLRDARNSQEQDRSSMGGGGGGGGGLGQEWIKDGTKSVDLSIARSSVEGTARGSVEYGARSVYAGDEHISLSMPPGPSASASPEFALRSKLPTILSVAEMEGLEVKGDNKDLEAKGNRGPGGERS